MAETSTLVTDLMRTSVATANLTANMMASLPTGGKYSLLHPYMFEFGNYEIVRSPVGQIDMTCVTPDIAPPPEEPALDLVSPADIPMAPTFNEPPPAVNLDIAKPAPFMGSVPAAPQLSEVTIPPLAPLDVPSASALLPVILPSVPVVSLPTFSELAPNAPGDIALQFGWNEESYQSDLMALLQSRAADLIESFNGGYDPEVEEAIWDKAREKGAQQLVAEIELARRHYGARGLSRAPGFLGNDIVVMQANRKMAIADSSRDVTLAQVELEQATRQLAFQTMVALEQSLVSYASAAALRALEAAKFVQSAAIDIYDAMVGRFQAEIQTVSALADAFKARITGEMSKLEVFKAELEGQRLIGKINVDLLEAYKAGLDGVTAQVKAYEANVYAVQVQIESAGAKIKAYGQEVQAYGSQVDAKTAEYKGYAAQIAGEVAKVGVLKAEADAYSSAARAHEVGTKAARDQALLEYKSKHELPLKAYRARLAGYRALVAKATAELQSKASSMQASARIWESHISSEQAVANATIDVQRAEGVVAGAQSEVTLAQQRGDWTINIANARQAVAVATAEAQREAGMAASAMSAVNISAGYSNQASYGESKSSNYDRSFNGFLGNSSAKEDRYTVRA